MTIWDAIYRNYQNGGEAWATLKDGLHPEFLTFLEQNDFETKKALDIGCGDGKYLRFLSAAGFEVTGLDSSETAISMTRESLNGIGEFILTDMYEYPFEASRYGLIVSHATLHHGAKKKVVTLLDKIHASLSADGKIFISLPCDDCKRNWAMMAEHEILADGTCIPLIGPEKGLPHSFFSKEEIDELLAGVYRNLTIKLDDRGKWIMTGQKKGQEE